MITLSNRTSSSQSELLKRNFKSALILVLFTPLIAWGNDSSNEIASASESPLQEVTTLANSGIVPPLNIYGADGISVAKNGDVFVSGGPVTKSVIRITADGVVSEFATGFESANGSDFDSQGNLFVADYKANAIRRITPDGVVSTFVTDLDGPAGVYIDSKDNVIVGLYGANFSGKAATVLRISPEGVSSILATGNGLLDVIGVVGDEKGNVFAGNYKKRQLYQITDGNVSLLTTASVKINMIDYSHGYIYIANNGRIVRVNASTGEEELVSGTPEAKTVNGPVSKADFVKPTSVAFSPDKKILYVADAVTGDVRKIAPKEQNK